MSNRAKVTKANGSAINADADLTVVSKDLFCANLFVITESTVRGQVIQCEPDYILKCYIKTPLKYCEEDNIGTT